MYLGLLLLCDTLLKSLSLLVSFKIIVESFTVAVGLVGNGGLGIKGLTNRLIDGLGLSLMARAIGISGAEVAVFEVHGLFSPEVLLWVGLFGSWMLMLLLLLLFCMLSWLNARFSLRTRLSLAVDEAEVADADALD